MTWNDTFTNTALVLARGLGPPAEFSTEDTDLAAGLDLEAWPELASARDAWVAAWRDLLAAPNREPALLAYARLFLGPFEIQVSPYASSYIDPQKRLMGETSQWVAERYAEAGLEPPADRPSDAPDHLALECEFLYFLGYQWKETGDAIWLQRIKKFLNDHLLLWAPDCTDQIAAADTSIYYQSLSKFLRAWLKILSEQKKT